MSQHREQGWHPAEIGAALKRVGSSWAAVSRKHRFHISAAQRVRYQCWPEMQAHIAAELDMEPAELWPLRYPKSGEPLTGNAPERWDQQSSRRHKSINTTLGRAA